MEIASPEPLTVSPAYGRLPLIEKGGGRMGGEAIFDESEAADIAADWGVDVDLLDGAAWELETIDGNQGETYGFQVRFDRNTDSDLLLSLGVTPGEFTRQVSLNAFDKPEPEE